MESSPLIGYILQALPHSFLLRKSESKKDQSEFHEKVRLGKEFFFLESLSSAPLCCGIGPSKKVGAFTKINAATMAEPTNPLRNVRQCYILLKRFHRQLCFSLLHFNSLCILTVRTHLCHHVSDGRTPSSVDC